MPLNVSYVSYFKYLYIFGINEYAQTYFVMVMESHLRLSEIRSAQVGVLNVPVDNSRVI